jgi:Ca2+-binding RTX toxin-like protein
MTTLRIPRYSAALATVAAAAAFAVPATANAAVGGALNGDVLTLTADDNANTITLGESGGNLTFTIDGNTITDFGGVAAPADGTIDVVLDALGGDDTIAVNITAGNAKSITVNGGDANDLITGSGAADTLNGDAGNDRITPAKNPGGTLDVANGGAGNDQLVWTPGDGSDTMNGDAGADEAEINGGHGDEIFNARLNPADATRTIFERTSAAAFTLDTGAVETLVLNANGGNDTMTSDPAVTVAERLNGGVGADNLQGGSAADLINGGDDNDALSGGGGDDRIVGDRGNDTMNGDNGDDTLVWNNGDGSDQMNGNAGLDRTEVNGATGAGDVFTIAPNGARSKFDRTNLGPFTLDIDVEALDVRGIGGDDSFTAAPGTGAHLAVTADGGSGNDTLTGAEEADTFSGGSGNDKLTGGSGPDVLDGNDGDDSLFARDSASDLIRGGAGTDSAQTDAAGVDVWDGLESVDATQVVTPPPADTTASPVTIGGGKNKLVRIKKGRARVKLALSCPAAEAGGCKGTVALISSKAVKIGNQRVRVVVGSANYSLNGGETKNVTVRLPKGLRKIAKNRKLAVRAQTITSDAAGNVATGSRSLTLRLPAKK